MNAVTPVVSKSPPQPLNGVNIPMLFATIDALRKQPALANFQFAVVSDWIAGTHTRSVIHGFTGAGGAQAHGTVFHADSDHPAVLCGEDAAPSPVEWLLHGLAGCLTAGIANIAAARGVALQEVTSTVTGEMDLQGILGLSKQARNGFSSVEVNFMVKADASPEKIAEIVKQAEARSAVFDVLTNGVPVTINVSTLIPPNRRRSALNRAAVRHVRLGDIPCPASLRSS
jgi:uncharacterized OsmC-like protein